MTLLVGAVVLWVVPIFVANAQGKAKRRAGFWYGLLLGWLGVLVLAVLPALPAAEPASAAGAAAIEPPAAMPESPLAARFASLEDLRARSLITDAEYEQRRAALLGEI